MRCERPADHPRANPAPQTQGKKTLQEPLQESTTDRGVKQHYRKQHQTNTLQTKYMAHLCARPRVHAKMLATGLVLVGLPFWCSRQWRVTVPARQQQQQQPYSQGAVLVVLACWYSCQHNRSTYRATAQHEEYPMACSVHSGCCCCCWHAPQDTLIYIHNS
jgi:hypothetical protein